MLHIESWEDDNDYLMETMTEILIDDIENSYRGAERIANRKGGKIDRKDLEHCFDYYFRGEDDPYDCERPLFIEDTTNTEECWSPVVTQSEPEMPPNLMLREDEVLETDLYKDAMEECREEVIQEVERDNQVSYRTRDINFMSRSKGRDKNGQQILRQHPKEVEFVMVDNRYALPVVRGELRQNSLHFWASKPDSLAEELLGEGATASQLLDEVRRRSR